MNRIIAVCVVSLLAGTGCSTSQSLFKGRDLAWTEIGSTSAWTFHGDTLQCSGKKDGYAWLSTNEQYGDFVLSLDWAIGDGGNTGVFLRADREGRTSMKGFEVQCKDDRQDMDLKDASGAVFSRVPASGRHANPPGEWNHLEVTCRGRKVKIKLNGHVTGEFDMDSIESMKAVPNTGYIGLQNHGTQAKFRNVRIRMLKSS